MITRNKITQEPDKPSKKQKWIVALIFKNTTTVYKKQSYDGVTNDKANESDDSSSDTDGCARNLDVKHKNEEDDDYIEPPSEKNVIIKSKLE